MTKPKLWTVVDAAEYLGFSVDHVRKMAARGRFPKGACAKLPGGRDWFFRPDVLEAWIFKDKKAKP